MVKMVLKKNYDPVLTVNGIAAKVSTHIKNGEKTDNIASALIITGFISLSLAEKIGIEIDTSESHYFSSGRYLQRKTLEGKEVSCSLQAIIDAIGTKK